MQSFSMQDFNKYYCQYGPMVLRRCRQILKNEENALDAMQDVFLNILEKQDSINNVCASLFYTTATHVCLNKIRSDKYRNHSDIEDLQEIITDSKSNLEEEKIDAKLLLNYIFDSRKEIDREIAILHFVDGYTLEETAEKLNMSVSGIRKRISNLKKYVGGLNIWLILILF